MGGREGGREGTRFGLVVVGVADESIMCTQVRRRLKL